MCEGVGRGELVVWLASQVCMDKGIFKGWTVWISKMQAKEKRTINCGICVLNAHMVLEDSMSRFLSLFIEWECHWLCGLADPG